MTNPINRLQRQGPGRIQRSGTKGGGRAGGRLRGRRRKPTSPWLNRLPATLPVSTGEDNQTGRGSAGAQAPLFEEGWKAGYEKGRQAGYDDFEQIFEGTSIIIPTYNQKEMLLQCLDRIEAYTPQPYEVIVVDDASSDGTAEALRQYRKVRVAVHDSNKGFAGSINTGLMLAKGRTVLLLNNDVFVAERWLANMLDCLESSPDIGAVGPVTNYIGGEQQIDVPYQDLRDLDRFAEERSRPDRSKWRETERLVGFCLLMRREIAHQTGYLDEGYRLGNFEDDDWIIRLRLQGLKLVIAGDAFVHHFGSVTMRSLDTNKYLEANERNRQLFSRKWGSIHEFLARDPSRRLQAGLQGCSSYEGFPAKVVVESGTGRLYWLQDGMKFRISAGGAYDQLAYAGPKVRVSQRDLRHLPYAGEWTLEQVKAALAELSAPAESGPFPYKEGAVIELPEGQWFQIDRGTARPILTRYTLEIWGLEPRISSGSADQLAVYPEGRPVLPPVILLANEL
ncbi:glycosyltransferase family 2 protein [Paenibacillus yonginensis]|nr:glycosyltransferase family 2 protein [Paenibacillus yonginensis]